MYAPAGRSLHIGLNHVDPSHYGGWEGTLTGCEFDANDMQQIASKRGLQTKVLLSEEATSEAVIEEITAAAADLRSGDIFMLTNSSHGGQVPDTNGDEPDEQDETWALFDRQLIDDELYGLWGRFAAGVRIVVLSDSCHSGSVVRAMFYEQSPAGAGAEDRFKMLPKEVQTRTYEANEGLYDGIQDANPQGDSAGIGASVLLISGCQDNQYSRDGDRNGLFTQTLKQVWADGTFTGGYRRFHHAIVDLMPPDQTPNYFRVGVVNALFEKQSPFSI